MNDDDDDIDEDDNDDDDEDDKDGDIFQRCGQAIRAMSRMTGMMRRSRFSIILNGDHCCSCENKDDFAKVETDNNQNLHDRESSPRTLRDGSESPAGEHSSNGLSSSTGLNSNDLSSGSLHLCGQNQDSKAGHQGLTSSTARVSSPLVSPNSTRRADKIPAGGELDLKTSILKLSSRRHQQAHQSPGLTKHIQEN